MQIKILATSDMHGYIMPTSYSEKKMDLPFGTAKAATMLKKLRASAKGPVFQIENGDFIQGSPLSYYVRKAETHSVEAITKIINQMNYDVSILGNHEFNYGLDYLKETIASYQQPVLAANILGKDGQPYFGQPYVIIEKQGVKVAILGVTTQYIPHWEQPATVKDLTFKSVVETAAEYVPKLREEADLVVVAYHGGFEKDLETGEPTELLTGENEGYDLLEKVSGIDALVTGHQHREIATKLNGIPVIQPGFRGAFVGEITLEIEPMAKGYRVIGSDAAIHPVGNEQPDTEVLALTTALHDEVEEWLDQPVGNVEGDMTIQNPNAVRLKEHPYIEFINNVQMASSGTDISGTALFNNEGKGFNNQITMRDIITNYIYPNTLAVLRVTGQDLREALEQSATYFVLEKGQPIFNPKYVDPKPQYYNYDMYEGIEYTLDLRQPFGERVTKLNYHGKAVQAEDVLEIVTNQYRAVGGGNYQMFQPEKIIREIQIDMTELIAEYLKKHPIIQASTNDNFKVIW
ncbi:bifunctional metallophosphatase/5'-nucleotidase [Enterococcus faecalis]|uniref:bifunctional metallophosphatase/5'-nucleotidase n=1 Tax=Enterococcus TaxID=1350 RepID=UPI001925C8EF|nr:bifunctional metallophosphatase/5'-nucleotidase [Enterococcus faecalis]ELY8292825.1 bifunctional metallophosphatase/5'-nucleotidase [Enterococcus faecalis]MDN3114856.1 bifunctional metallophosphatase/5'-nucleotidase [Enterococcus faecalis]QXN79925.1 bifunctional metallophosphatase/5'-nucleotidase [Enterococcus faecalis]HBC4464080.1 bifunctional metallophosphatase/5'-nucleotidase [Enterococcus faecalis]